MKHVKRLLHGMAIVGGILLLLGAAGYLIGMFPWGAVGLLVLTLCYGIGYDSDML